MTTLIVQLPPGLAKRLARAADQLGMSHEELGTLAVRLFIQGAKEEAREGAKAQPTSRRRGGRRST